MRSTRRHFVGRAGLAAACVTTCPALGAGLQASTERRGIAMTIGLNRVGPHYGGGAPPLRGCVNDARDIHTIARLQKFECMAPLLDEQATSSAVMQGIRQAAKELKSGDIFLIQFSGHGAQIPDTNGDEPDGKDETWCLYDRMLIDDELARLWAEFAEGVRILMLSDSCHSGSVARGNTYMAAVEQGEDKEARGDAGIDEKPVFRFMPDDVVRQTYQKHKDEYNAIVDALPRSRGSDDEGIKASVLLISGCQDNQFSGDLSSNGLFTMRLKQVWGNGKFKGNYRAFHSQIVSGMPSTQTPNFYPIGQPDLGFWMQRPFTI